jgi:hypothetical protein
MIVFLIAAAVSSTQIAPGRYEGDWYISDTTDNITGEREVEAMQLHLERGDPNYVTIRMRCSNAKPTIYVEWDDSSFPSQKLWFPDQTVLMISPILADFTNPKSQQFIFEKSEDSIDRGLRASPESSASLVSLIGSAKRINLVAYLSASSKNVEIDVNGTQGAWSRVSRNCPVKNMLLPPK